MNLVPGVYAVSFNLTGFNAVRREGVELTASFTATVNADLRVGALEETVTVSGEAPIVDVQSVTQQRVLDKEVLDAYDEAKRHQHDIGKAEFVRVAMLGQAKLEEPVAK